MNTEQSIEELEKEIELLKLQRERDKLKRKIENKLSLLSLFLYCIHALAIVIGILFLAIVGDVALFFLTLSVVSIAVLVIAIIYRKNWLHILCFVFDALNIVIGVLFLASNIN